MRIALIVGHSKTSQGAVNKNSKLSEFQYNDVLVNDIYALLIKRGFDVVLVYRNTYKALPKKVNATNPDIIISFHCNAYNCKASGSEVLYHYRSKNGEQLAKKLQKAIVKVLKLPDRGIKPRSVEDRGGYLLKYTNAPCVIIEPFFIDNDNDLATARAKHNELAQAIANAV